MSAVKQWPSPSWTKGKKQSSVVLAATRASRRRASTLDVRSARTASAKPHWPTRASACCCGEKASAASSAPTRQPNHRPRSKRALVLALAQAGAPHQERPLVCLWACQDLNLGPPRYKLGALPTELHAQEPKTFYQKNTPMPHENTLVCGEGVFFDLFRA